MRGPVEWESDHPDSGTPDFSASKCQQDEIELQRAVIEAARKHQRQAIQDYRGHECPCDLCKALRALDGSQPRIKADKASASEIIKTVCGEPCPTCKGSGKVIVAGTVDINSGYWDDYEKDCPACRGTGRRR